MYTVPNTPSPPLLKLFPSSRPRYRVRKGPERRRSHKGSPSYVPLFIPVIPDLKSFVKDLLHLVFLLLQEVSFKSVPFPRPHPEGILCRKPRVVSHISSHHPFFRPLISLLVWSLSRLRVTLLQLPFHPFQLNLYLWPKVHARPRGYKASVNDIVPFRCYLNIVKTKNILLGCGLVLRYLKSILHSSRSSPIKSVTLKPPVESSDPESIEQSEERVL